MKWAWLAAVFAVGCGSSVVDDTPSTTGSASSSTTGSASSTVGGTGGASSTTSVGSGGTGGGLPASTCVGLDYCGCTASSACSVVAEDCFCPCGVEPCEPPCDCECGGGKYLGCAPTTILNEGALEGIWLIGWSGGLHHFSWVRIEPGNAITVNDGAALSSNLPYYACNGPADYILTAMPETIGLQLPGDCGFSSLTFKEWRGTPVWPAGCLQEVVLVDNLTATELMGCRFPLEQCDASMSVCIDPLAP